MIKKITKLKDFGIYNDFRWNTLDEFSKKNLIYGWNYSGKTTLSKLFENLEFNNSDRHFQGSQFNLEFENSNVRKTIDQTNIHECPAKVKTFNSEYIKRIFSWEIADSGIEPISFYLGDPAGNLLSEIESLESQNIRLINIRDQRYKRILNLFTEYNKSNGKFTLQAKEIREDYLPRLLQPHEFNKSHFNAVVNVVKDDLDSHILNEDVKNSTKDEALAQQEFDPVSNLILIDEELTVIGEKVKTLLNDTAPKSIEFPELDSNDDLFIWVQTGVGIHQDTTTCKFCTNVIPSDRISQLNSYYSEKLKEIQELIAEIKSSIVSERININIQFENELKICNLYRTEYTLAQSIFDIAKTKYLSQLTIFEQDLELKGKSIFTPLIAQSYTTVALGTELAKINEVIDKHNSWVSEFTERKETATTKILNNYVAEFLRDENYLVKEIESNSAISKISEIDQKINSNKTEIVAKNAQLSDMVKGKEELNASLSLLLNRNDIKIEIDDEKFILKRNGYAANNLSEGEKSAIAFSYFLTELKSLSEDATLPNTIVFIDDPISSLDSNHVFQVRSLINNFFRTNEFKQLFISTHSFEFLSVLLDTNLFGRIAQNTGEPKRPLYFIQRVNENEAEIKKLPKAFSSYKSEYVGLFRIINEYNTSDDKENFPNLLILPNAVRRFLELYTLMKYPSEQEVDKRVQEVFNSGDQTYHSVKLLHWFSHENQLEKINQHDDKLLQISEAISELFNYIKNADQLHWKGLVGE